MTVTVIKIGRTLAVPPMKLEWNETTMHHEISLLIP
jgi:hypothetical protein